MIDPDDLHRRVRVACVAAGVAILSVRERGYEARRKADGTPVTQADRAASQILGEHLRALDPGVPVVCEEAGQDPGTAVRYWLVDPLDGTREFLLGSDRFTVNVALVNDGRVEFGLIHAPASGVCWWGGAGRGASRDGKPIRARAMGGAPRILCSPAEPREPPARLIAALCHELPDARCEYLPGAIKFCLLAEGQADCHPRSVPCHGWDSAAGQAILEGAGGAVYRANGQPLDYPPRPGWLNPMFLAVADRSLDWGVVLAAT